VDKTKGFDDDPSAERNASSKDGGDVYLASTITHSNHDAWLINSCVSFHVIPQREWFCEYEKYNVGDIFLGDDSTAKIIGHGTVRLLLKDGRVKTLPSVPHIPVLAKNLIFVSKMSDVDVQTIFERIHARWFKEQWC